MTDTQQLTVLTWDASGPTFADKSAEAGDYARDAFAFPTDADDFIYLGRVKPWGAVYIEMGTASGTANTLSAEYWNGTAWTALTLHTDGTKGLTRSGFVRWMYPKSAGVSLWEEATVNSVEQYWVRLSFASDISGSPTIQGLSIVFADDEDLKREDYGVLALLPENENEVAATSHILSHEAARDAIMRDLNATGKFRTNPTTGDPEPFDPYDLLDISQVRLAAVYKALERIYFAASDSQEDIYWTKAAHYSQLYSKAMEVYVLTLDKDGDGVATGDEMTSGFAGGTFLRS